MCLLIILTGFDDDYPVLVAGNRDEQRARIAAPPGLFVGQRRRMLSPRDRKAGGTWMAVNDAGMFAGLTNLSAGEERAEAPTRGNLPHLALDRDDVDGGVEAVLREVESSHYNGFQLAISDGRSSAVVLHGDGDTRVERPGPVAVMGNDHRVGTLKLPAVDAATGEGLQLEQRLDALRSVLCDPGEVGGHRVLKKGGDYGTVSSSLVAVHREDAAALVWRYAPGPPDETDYRNYGNLGRRLLG